MSGFVKVFSSLLESTVWLGQPSHVKLAWITILAKAGPTGEVTTPVPVLASLAGISLAEFEAALGVFLAPDKYSRSQEHDGRRLEPLPASAEFSGFVVLNYLKYRELRERETRREQNRQSQARKRARDKRRVADSSVTHADNQRCQPESAQAEAEAEAEAEAPPPLPPAGGASEGEDPGLLTGTDRPEFRRHERMWDTTVESWGGWTDAQADRLRACRLRPAELAGTFELHYRKTGARFRNPEGWEAAAEEWVLKRETELREPAAKPAHRQPVQPSHGKTGWENSQ